MSVNDDHFLLILSDSQLPIGSFAYSSGLESASIHNRQSNTSDFLEDSIHSIAGTTIPFLRAAYLDPGRAIVIDDTLDANMPCQVARRASVTQGRALLKLIDKTFLRHCTASNASVAENVRRYRASVMQIDALASGHFGIVFGLAGRVLEIPLDKLIFAFLQTHAKAVLSAAVRLSLIGPYESTHLLAAQSTRELLIQKVKESETMSMDDSGQTFSLIDIWQGRHELLYSRIFSA